MTDMEIPRAARNAYRKLWAGLMAVKPQLDTPYPDDPRWTPWTRFVESRLSDLQQALEAALHPSEAETKALMETATRVALELGRKEAAGEIRAEIMGLPTHTLEGEPIIARDVRFAAARTARRIWLGLDGDDVPPQPSGAVSKPLTASPASPSTPEDSEARSIRIPDLPEEREGQ